MLLAALMLVSCLSPAFAEEGEQAQTDYERWGSYLNWTDGQKAEAFHNWDDERWNAYWYGTYDYDAGVYRAGCLELEQNDEAMTDWEADQGVYFQDFVQMGAYGTWTDAQKDQAFEQWTNLRWEAYWQAYYDSYDWPDYSQYEADSDRFDSDWYGRMAVDDGWEEQIRQEKADMGMPYPDGVNVTLNGEYLDFGGTAPVAVENRTMVPVRAFLETLGAKVDYQNGVISAVLESGDTLEMRMDSTILTCVRGDKIGEIDMGVTPWTQGQRTYIPARFAGEAVGLSVAWDSTYQVAHFTDWDEIVSGLDGRFTVLNAMLGAERERIDPEQTYAIDSTASGAVTLYGETERENGTATLSAGAKGLLQGGKLDLTYGLKLDLGSLREMLTAQMDEETLSALELLSDFQVQLRGDLGAGMFYLKGNKLDRLPDSPIPANTWLAMNLGQSIDVDALYESIYTALEGQPAPTVGGLLAGSYGRLDYAYGGMAPCARVLDAAAPLEILFGDANFKTATAGNTTTYTLNMDALKLAARLRELTADETDRVGIDAVLALLTGDLKTDYALTVRMRDNKLLDCKLSGDIRLPASFTQSMPIALSFNLSIDGEHISGGYTVKGDYIGKVEMKMDIKVTESSRSVPTAPAAGEKVLDLEALTGTSPAGGFSTAMEKGLSMAAGLLK